MTAVFGGLLWDPYLVDSAFLVRDLGQGLAEYPDVVDSESCHAGRNWLRDDVGRVVGSSDADFENSRIDLWRVPFQFQVGRRQRGSGSRLTRSCRKTCMAMMVR